MFLALSIAFLSSISVSPSLTSDAGVLDNFISFDSTMGGSIKTFGSYDTYSQIFHRDIYATLVRNGIDVFSTNFFLPFSPTDDPSIRFDLGINAQMFFLNLVGEDADDVYIPYDPDFIDYSIETSNLTNSQIRTRWRFFAERYGEPDDHFYDIYGKRVYCLKPTKLTIDSYTSLAQTYESYFERLYNISAGDDCSWSQEEIDVWGDVVPPSEYFEFNVNNSAAFITDYFDLNYPTNFDVGYRHIAFSRNFIEGKNILNLKNVIKTKLFSGGAEIRSGARTYYRPDMVYRPRWIMDASNYPNAGGSAYVWWSTTAPLPKIAQGGEMPQGGSSAAFPIFDWSSDPQVKWGLYGVTLNGVCGNNDYVPCRILFNSLRPPAFINNIVPFNFGGSGSHLSMFLTNAYPVCAASCIHDSSSYSRYVENSWNFNNVLRFNPENLVGINQVLGLMDRTYHIPDMKFSSNNEKTKNIVKASFEAEEYIPLSALLDLWSSTFVLENPEGVNSITARTGSSTATTQKSSDTGSNDGLVFWIDGIHDSNTLIKGIDDSSIAYLDKYELARISGQGRHVLDVHDVSTDTLVGGREVFILDAVLDGVTNRIETYGCSPRIDFVLHPAGTIYREYTYSIPTNYAVNVSRAIPGNLVSDEIVEKREIIAISFLSSTKEDAGVVTSNTVYRSYLHGASKVGPVSNNVKSVVLPDVVESMSERIAVDVGRDFRNPLQFAEIPDGLEHEFTIGDTGHIDAWWCAPAENIFRTRNVTNEYWEAYFALTNAFIHRHPIVSNLTENVEALFRLDIIGVHPEGWSSTNHFDIKFDEYSSYSSITNGYYEEEYKEITSIPETGPYVFDNSNDCISITVEHDFVFEHYTIRDIESNIESNVVMLGTEWYEWGSSIPVSNKYEHIRDYVTYEGGTESESGETYGHRESITNTVTLADATRSEHIVVTYPYTSFLRFEYTVSGGVAEDITLRHVFKNPITGQYEFEYDSVPKLIGEIQVDNMQLPISMSNDGMGGLNGGYNAKANTKIMTDTHWSFNGLKRTDRR